MSSAVAYFHDGSISMIIPSSYLLWLEREKRPIHYDLYSSGMCPEEHDVIVPQTKLTSPSMNGSPELRYLIAQKYNIKPENVFVTTGVSLLVQLVVQTFLSTKDIVAIETPVYEPLWLGPKSLGCAIQRLSRSFEQGFALPLPPHQKPTPAMIILTNPHNPSGTSLSQRNLEELAAYADENKTLILSDEVYSDAAFIPSPPLYTLTKYALSISHLNKPYGLGKLKIGWVVGEESLITKIADANTLLHADVSSVIDKKAQEVLRDEDMWKWLTRARLKKNYPVMEEWIAKQKLQSVPPNGTPIWLVKVPVKDTRTFVERLIEQYQTRVIPGSFFGAEGFFRIGYSVKEDILCEGLRRLGNALDTWK